MKFTEVDDKLINLVANKDYELVRQLCSGLNYTDYDFQILLILGQLSEHTVCYFFEYFYNGLTPEPEILKVGSNEINIKVNCGFINNHPTLSNLVISANVNYFDNQYEIRPYKPEKINDILEEDIKLYIFEMAKNAFEYLSETFPPKKP